jgi:DnaJ-class molecular chaperone
MFFQSSEKTPIDFKKDYYGILKVDENAEIQVIKQSFYQLAK